MLTLVQWYKIIHVMIHYHCHLQFIIAIINLQDDSVDDIYDEAVPRAVNNALHYNNYVIMISSL